MSDEPRRYLSARIGTGQPDDPYRPAVDAIPGARWGMAGETVDGFIVDVVAPEDVHAAIVESGGVPCL